MKENTIANRHIYEAGIIGNCSYIAHVGIDTNISWLCWPSFEDSFVFGGLIDKTQGGCFVVKPEEEIVETKQYYIKNSNILCTEIHTESFAYRITDFAPRFEQFGRYFKPLMLIRKIEPLRGAPSVNIQCQPTGNYGRSTLKATRGSNHILYSGAENGERIRLTTDVPISHFFQDDSWTIISDNKYLILTYEAAFESAIASTCEDFLQKTLSYWQRWIKRCSIPNIYQKEVIRSALVLKLHQYEDTGAIIAASTTSLPEFPGSGRNWDYRYCWVRDSYYVLTALAHIGQFEEMESFANYIAGITHHNPGRLQPLYGILGNAELTEHILPDLKGYQDSGPVRIGNQAFEHIQNDVYGQAMIALLPLFTDQRFKIHENKNVLGWVNFILEKIEATIDEKDAGIWEFRNFANHHCYSNLFQWVGCKAALLIARQNGYQDMEQRATVLLEKAAAYIEACYDNERKVYQNALESQNLDASTLQLIVMDYLDPKSDRARQHLEVLEKELKGENGLFYRYKHQDDFGKPKATFLVCAFWYVEALACVGRVEEAKEILERLLTYSNHLGLFSEDVTEDNGSQWGNFPQAYSHVGLMNAVYRLAIKLDKPIFSL